MGNGGGGAPGQLEATAAPSLVVRAVRRQDMLVLDFAFFNAEVVPGGGFEDSVVRPLSSSEHAYMAVRFPPQAVAENVYVAETAPPGLGMTASALAGPSRLAFVLPPEGLPLRVDALLAWTDLEPSLVPVAEMQAGTTPPVVAELREPDSHVTAIEAVWGLLLSPGPGGRWAHATAPSEHGNRYELWQTRLVNDQPARAVWSYPPPPKNGAGKNDTSVPGAIGASDRQRLVCATSDYANVAPEHHNKVVPFTVERLHLGALGASLSAQGSWEGDVLTIEHWRHRSTGGRDHAVRLVKAGFIFPFGHRASRVDVTERVVEDGIAYLERRSYIVIRETEKHFTGATGEPNGGRANPFRSVRITTISTPEVELRRADASRILFWIDDAGTNQPLPFHLVARDWEGRAIELTAPLLFVAHSLDEYGPFNRGAFENFYTYAELGTARSPLVVRPLGGQRVAMAPTVGAEPGSTALEVHDIVLGFELPMATTTQEHLEKAAQPAFFPTARTGTFRLLAAEAVAGAPRPPVAFTLDETPFDGGENSCEVFAALSIDNPPILDVPAERAGGLAAPRTLIRGVSRRTGVVGGELMTLKKGQFDPVAYLDSSGASPPKLLGGLDLVKILGPGGLDGAPRIVTRPVHPGNDVGKPPSGLRTEMVWHPPLKALSDPLPGLFDPGPGAALEIRSILESRFDGSPSTYDLDGDLTNFTMNLVGTPAFITLRFNRLRFTSRSGAKPQVDVDIGSVEFAGPLSFVNDLRSFLTSEGAGFAVDVTTTHIAAGYTLAIPNTTVGVFSLQNMALSAGLMLPFGDAPMALRFAFSSREQPFLLTVNGLGGTGFVGVELSITGMRTLEVQLGFGAAIAFNLAGLASGGVSVMAGMIFSLEQTAPAANGLGAKYTVKLGGFLRIYGCVEVLGLVSASIELYMQLVYEDPGKAVGSATLTLRVDVAFFSKSFSRTVQRRLGGGGDPTFEEGISEEDWRAYCAAFAYDRFTADPVDL